MTSNAGLVVLALLAGIAVALQAQFMGQMNRVAGTATAVLITYGGGTVVALLVWLFSGRPVTGVRDLPALSWTAGVLGLVIVGGIGFASPRLGLSRTIILTVAAQLAAAIAIDHFGLFDAPQRSLDLQRLSGVVLALVGAWLVVKS